MSKNKTHPHRSKPYDQKLAERTAAKRAMRTGGEAGGVSQQQMRPDMPGNMPNPTQDSRELSKDKSNLIGGPDAERNPFKGSASSKDAKSKSATSCERQVSRYTDGPPKDEI